MPLSCRDCEQTTGCSNLSDFFFLSCFFFFLLYKILCGPRLPQVLCVAEGQLVLLSLLPLPPRYRDCSHTPPCPVARLFSLRSRTDILDQGPFYSNPGLLPTTQVTPALQPAHRHHLTFPMLDPLPSYGDFSWPAPVYSMGLVSLRHLETDMLSCCLHESSREKRYSGVEQRSHTY